MINSIEFKISEDKAIIIDFPCEIQELHRYSEINIFMKSISALQNYQLYESDFAIEGIRTFKNMLEKAIKYELELHSSLKENRIGYLCNEYFQDKSNLVMYENNGNTCWIGLNFSLWCSNQYKTWIYNEKSKIFIEVTPIYNDTDEGDECNDNKKYEEFLLNYNPIVVEVLENDVVLQWLAKCEELLNIIQKNDCVGK
jgi:hypothetical protein